MDEQTTSELQGCDVCGTVVTHDEGYLRLETEHGEYGHVCSWLCAAQFSVSKAAEQRKILESKIEELMNQSGNREAEKYLIGFYRPGIY